MENKRKTTPEYANVLLQKRGAVVSKVEERDKQNPELMEKFYKQIINSFGYAHSAKL